MSIRKAIVVCGLGFGDEGKGTLVDHLVRAHGARTVCRYNGGPQAGHNVVTDDGRWHCFAQLGAGAFAGARTVLGPAMAVELEALAAEADVFATKHGAVDVLGTVTIDPGCVLVTPMHKLVNQLGELAAPRGSCGMGVGETVKWRDRGLALCAGELAGDAAHAVLERLRDHALATADVLLGEAPTPAMLEVARYFRARCAPAQLLERYREIAARVAIAPAATVDGVVVFEGAQGALLDRTRGFVPFVTQSRTTFEHAVALAGDDVLRIGAIRAFAHRHGRGPLVTEDPALPLADPYNRDNRWQGPFRVGHLDVVALRYGLALAGSLDALAVTNLDRLADLPELRLCTSYEYTGALSALDGVLAYERLGPGRARIRTLAPPVDLAAARRLTAIVEACRPLDWIVLDGFASLATDAPLPESARRYLDAIERATGVPIAIVSIAPDDAGKRTYP